jgi:alcohol dehydrogenase (cytochrome c)
LALVLVAAAVLLLMSASSANVGWTTYNGNVSGNRYSPLGRINSTNVSGLKPLARILIPSEGGLETTPLVDGQTMFVTSTNSVYTYSLPKVTPGWSFVRAPTTGVIQDAGTGINRGAAIGNGSVFLTTDNAHLLCLNESTGALQWETTMADSARNYGSTAAPLYLAGLNLIVSGISGGDSGVQGFLAAWDATAGGNPLWQFYTTPSSPSDPLAATWGSGAVLPHGGGATWMTGTFDATSNTLYWGVGNPGPDMNGDSRQGDNLYTSSVLAINPLGGALLWYFQFTPHGVWDYDGTATPMLVTTTWQGGPRNLLMHANRNGYFYVLDRGTGQYLSGFPFVTNLTWSTGLDANGVPTVNQAAVPTTTGVQSCPALAGAANWQSTAYSPTTGYFYVQALENCSMFYKQANPVWQAGQEFPGGSARPVTGMVPIKHLRAINPRTGTIQWDYSQKTNGRSMGGVLATGGGLVFVAEDTGYFTALDAASGNVLWTLNLHAAWKASPMTYQVNGQQYVSIATPQAVYIFGL